MSGQHQQPEVPDQDWSCQLWHPLRPVGVQRLHGLLPREDDLGLGAEGGGLPGLAAEAVQQGAVQALR